MGLIEDLVMIVLGPVFWFLWIIWAIIGILLIVGLIVFLRYSSKKTINTTMRIVFFTFLQTLLFLSLLWMFEIFGILTLVVTRFNVQIFNLGELAMVFFIIIIITDLLIDILRYFIKNFLPPSVVLRATIISFIQLLFLLLLLSILDYTGIISLMFSSDIPIIAGSEVALLVFFYAWILISEMVIEYLRIKIIGEKKR